jgi:hypothetical protein
LPGRVGCIGRNFQQGNVETLLVDLFAAILAARIVAL